MGRVDLIDQANRLIQCLDEHARLGLDEQGDVIVGAELLQTSLDTVYEERTRVGCRVFHMLVSDESTAEGDKRYAQTPGDVDTSLHQVDAALPPRKIGADE